MRDQPTRFLSSVCAFLLTVVVVIAADQWTKHFALTGLRYAQPVSVIPGLFNLTLHFNPGVAFGLFADLEPFWRMIVLSLTTTLAFGFIAFFLMKDFRSDQIGRLALAVIVGGALGNIIDRVRFGYVIDFLDFYVSSYHWPTFNIADSCICVGVVVLLFRSPHARRSQADRSDSSLQESAQ